MDAEADEPRPENTARDEVFGAAESYPDVDEAVGIEPADEIDVGVDPSDMDGIGWAAVTSSTTRSSTPAPSALRRLDRRLWASAWTLSLLIHGAVFAATYAMIRLHILRSPFGRVENGDQGGGDAQAFDVLASAGAISETPQQPVLLPSPALFPPESHGYSVDSAFPPTTDVGWEEASRTLPHSSPAEMIPVPRPDRDRAMLGVPTREAEPHSRHFDVSRLAQPDAAPRGVAPGEQRTVVPAQPLSTPARIAGSAGGRGATRGRRGDEGGVDERGLPIPDYPAESRRRRESGTVEVKVLILPDGSVGSAAVEKDSGYPRLNESALAAAKKARFEPATTGGRPVERFLVIPYRFVLP